MSNFTAVSSGIKLMGSIKKKPLWKEYWDEETKSYYYYNTKTKKSQWDKPEELLTKAEKAAIAAAEQRQLAFFADMEARVFARLGLERGSGTAEMARTRAPFGAGGRRGRRFPSSSLLLV
uniref:WW domain-containing protein n=1 Tax=Heterosigma akashiwo TaxID=2829 RepID=A0A7S3Y2Q8_HETAK|mmetsp:Transcript_28484/g.46445  ORF Transcript_28484/g.46445 Transcript_28484/m.46445 type:complete len:120 (+) Transcript_28484:117-476(+)